MHVQDVGNGHTSNNWLRLKGRIQYNGGGQFIPSDPVEVALLGVMLYEVNYFLGFVPEEARDDLVAVLKSCSLFGHKGVHDDCSEGI